MVNYRHLFISVTVFFFILTSNLFPQNYPDVVVTQTSLSQLSEEDFQEALRKYVGEKFINYSEDAIYKERFLIALMRLVNHEMENRITNRRAAIEKYFNDLRSQLNELNQLQGRLDNAGISELNAFVSELENRMKKALNSGEIDYKKKKVFEDALQLLYVAEEMIKLDQLSDPDNLNRKISSSKDKLLSAFGEVGEIENIPLDVKPTIFNLFDEWRKTDSYKYSARLMDVKLVRSQLLKSGSVEAVNRMFNDQLRYAYIQFNDFNYDLADRLFEDLINGYDRTGIKDFVDIYYYWGESNYALGRLLRSREIFLQLLEKYPSSPYLSRVQGRLIQIAYKLDRFDEVVKHYAAYQNISSPREPGYYDILFAVALAYYNQADFNEAVEILVSFPEESQYYYFTQYLVGNIYAAGQNYDLAIDVFESLTLSRQTPPEFRNRALLKLGQIQYERGAYLTAINIAETIPEDFSRFDRVLNLLAWSHFMMEQTVTPGPEQRDYTAAKLYANRLLEEFYGSEHRMEAESLLGYIHQLENNLSLARNYYKNVYDSKINRNFMHQYLQEKDSLLVQYYSRLSEAEQALQNEDRPAYQSALEKVQNIQEEIWAMDYAEISAVGFEISREINGLLAQIDEMNVLKEQARELGNSQVMAKIDSVILRLRNSLDLISRQYSEEGLMFSAFPVARKVADYEYSSTKNRQLQDEIKGEIERLDADIQFLQQEVDRARLNNNYDKVVDLEQKIQKLEEIRKDYDGLYADAFDLEAGESYQEFDRWGDFGAVGIIDVDFGERDRIQQKMATVSSVYNSVLDQIADRREVVEDQLKKIEAEIRFMTMKARLAERQRLRAQREQLFRETYFDTRTSEFEEK